MPSRFRSLSLAPAVSGTDIASFVRPGGRAVGRAYLEGSLASPGLARYSLLLGPSLSLPDGCSIESSSEAFDSEKRRGRVGEEGKQNSSKREESEGGRGS
eukprot:3832139-Rhodomonas_salina.1